MQGRLERWSPLAGVAFVALFVVAGVLFDGQPGPGASDEEIRSYYGKDGNQVKLEGAFFLATLAGAVFIWFVGSLAATLGRAEGDGFWLSRIVLVSGGAFVALYVVAAAVNQFIADAADDNPGEFEIDPDTARLLTNGAYSLSPEAALPLAAPLVAAASLVFLRAAMVPRWIGWVGLAVAVGCVLGFLGVTVGLFLLWVAAVSVLLRIRGIAPTLATPAANRPA